MPREVSPVRHALPGSIGEVPDWSSPRGRGHEVSDQPASQLAELYELRQQGRGDRFSPPLQAVQRSAGGASPATANHRVTADRALYRTPRRTSRSDLIGCVALS